jgi:two-component system nitrate/nitrite response regulator NarL
MFLASKVGWAVLGDGVFDLKAPTKNEADKVATVIIADGTRMDCYLLADAVQHNARLQVVGCVTSSTEVVNTVCKSQPDVALISTRLEDGPFAGLVALRKLRALRPRSRIIMLLDEGNSELVVEAFRNRARGIFCRTGAPADLRKCIQRVNEGQIWVNNTHSEYIVSAVMQAPPARVVRADVARVLSKREKEVALLVATGLSNREIYEKLTLSRHTVKNCLSRIFEKLGIRTRTELVLYMLSQASPPDSEETKPPQKIPLTTYKLGA